jgi:hypothetical protein
MFVSGPGRSQRWFLTMSAAKISSAVAPRRRIVPAKLTSVSCCTPFGIRSPIGGAGPPFVYFANRFSGTAARLSQAVDIAANGTSSGDVSHS